jgi:hypothetical protein
MQCKPRSEKAVSANFQTQPKKGTVRGHRKAMKTHHEGQHTLGLVTRHLTEGICPTEKTESPQSATYFKTREKGRDF